MPLIKSSQILDLGYGGSCGHLHNLSPKSARILSLLTRAKLSLPPRQHTFFVIPVRKNTSRATPATPKYFSCHSCHAKTLFLPLPPCQNTFLAAHATPKHYFCRYCRAKTLFLPLSPRQNTFFATPATPKHFSCPFCIAKNTYWSQLVTTWQHLVTEWQHLATNNDKSSAQISIPQLLLLRLTFKDILISGCTTDKNRRHLDQNCSL